TIVALRAIGWARPVITVWGHMDTMHGQHVDVLILPIRYENLFHSSIVEKVLTEHLCSHTVHWHRSGGHLLVVALSVGGVWPELRANECKEYIQGQWPIGPGCWLHITPN